MPALKPRSAPSALHVTLSYVRKYGLFALARWWLILPLMIAGAGLAYWQNAQKPPSFASTGRMMVSGRIALPDGAVYSEEISNFYGTQMALMQSSYVRQQATSRVDSEHPEIRPSPADLSIQQQRGTSFFVLSVTGADPKYCQALLDAVMTEYVQYKREMRSDSANSATTAVMEQLVKLERSLQADQAELAAFQKKDNVLFLEEEGNSAGRRLLKLRGELADLQREHNLLQLLDVDQNLERKTRNEPDGNEATTGNEMATNGMKGSDSAYLRAKQEIQILRSKVEHFSRYLQPKHPKMVALADAVQEQERLIQLFREGSAADAKTRMSSISLQIQNLTTEIKKVEEQAADLNQRIADYNRIKERVERNKALSDKLMSTNQSVEVNKSLGQDVVMILEKASPAIATSAGVARSIAVGAVAGLFIGLGVVTLIAFFDDRIFSLVDLQHALSEDLLVQLPRDELTENFSLFEMEKQTPQFAQGCKNLRSSLLFMNFDGHRPKTILITSSVPGEGKSTVSASLALSLATAGSRTLLMDADLRKGRIHEFFDAAQRPGLTEVLLGEVASEVAVIATKNDKLFVLPRGRPMSNASEFFLRDSMDEFLRSIYPSYDYIIVDSAPVLAKEDTASLAPKMDASLFVVRAGVATRQTSRSALDTLHKRSVNVLGIIFNSVERSSPGYYYYDSYNDPEAEDELRPVPANVRDDGERLS